MNSEFDEVLTKLSPRERELLSLEIGQAVADAMAAQETAKAEAADPGNIRQANLAKMYGSCAAPVKPDLTIKERTHEAMAAWKAGERWPSTSFYPAMDFEARERAQKTEADRIEEIKNSDLAAAWDREQKAKGDS